MTVVDLHVTRARLLKSPNIEIPDLSQPKYQHFWRDPQLKGLAEIAKRYRVEMAYAQYTEQAILAAMFGNVMGAVRTTIAAGAVSQTSLLTGALNAATNPGNSGNMDTTPNGTAWVVTGHPTSNVGTNTQWNTFTNVQALKLTSSGATTLTYASQTIATAITAADPVFVFGSSSAGGATTAGSGGPMLGLAQSLFIGLSSQAFSGATQANVLTGENNPVTATGGYARIGAPTSSVPGAGAVYANALWNNQTNWPLPTAATPSVLTTGNGPWSFPASTAAWASGATNMQTMFICDTATGTTAGTNVNILAIGALGTSQAVNAASITLSFATGAITLTLT